MGTPPPQQTPQGTPPAGYAYPPQSGYAGPPPAGYGSPMAYNPAPARPMNWDMISFGLRFIGFLLLAVGAIVVAAFGSVPGSCFQSGSTCTATSSTVQGIANSILFGRVFFALGALLLGMGAGVKLHWVLRMPADAKVEQLSWVILERFFNYAVLGFSILILWWVFSGVHFPVIGVNGIQF